MDPGLANKFVSSGEDFFRGLIWVWRRVCKGFHVRYLLFDALAKDDPVKLGPAKAAPTQQRLAPTVLEDMSCTAQSHCTRQMLTPHWPPRLLGRCWCHQAPCSSGADSSGHGKSLCHGCCMWVWCSQFSRGGAAKLWRAGRREVSQDGNCAERVEAMKPGVTGTWEREGWEGSTDWGMSNN